MNSRFPLDSLRFLYVGSSDVGRDLEYYLKTLGAVEVWDRTAFGTRVAAVRLSNGPLVLLAGHRETPSCLPIFEAKDLERTVAEMKKRGWHSERGPIEIPNGPCYVFKDPSGNELAIFQETRPGVLGE
ncbi:MAG TPA: VOC family protein [Candidatus Dormibacteraeota bacterium]|jgi:predicted enzyme related to lactoylglutathione lyase|nr:VOC family protein [Candidatus Dormibacteraeota bacterium]